MQDIKQELKNKLKAAGKIALLGIGSELRGDDFAGMLVADRLKNVFLQKTNLKVIFGGAAPENFAGEIINFKPTHLIIIDSADLGKEAGKIDLIPEENIGGASFSTHGLPLKTLIDYLKISINCRFIFIGIQPKAIKLGEPVSQEVAKAVNLISDYIEEAVGEV